MIPADVPSDYLREAGIIDPGYSATHKIFTDKLIHRAPDCGMACAEGTYSNVPLSLSAMLSDAEKLDALRRLDQFRQWRSLDEKRYCLVCSKIITGREIQVAGGTRSNGSLTLSCPTERCDSIPMDWVLPTDEIIAKLEMLAAEERKAAAPSPMNHNNGRLKRPKRPHNDIPSRWRKFAFHFKRSA